GDHAVAAAPRRGAIRRRAKERDAVLGLDRLPRGRGGWRRQRRRELAEQIERHERRDREHAASLSDVMGRCDEAKSERGRYGRGPQPGTCVVWYVVVVSVVPVPVGGAWPFQ